MTTVTGSVKTLRLLKPAADAEAYQEVLGLLDQQTRRLRQVVDEVLQLTRFEAGRLEVQIQAVSLRPWSQHLVERLNAELNLTRAGYRFASAEHGIAGLQVLGREQPALVLLDVSMPKLDGWETCRLIRQVSDVPILMLTGRAEEVEKAKGLDLGPTIT